jgi:hypothetical protein
VRSEESQAENWLYDVLGRVSDTEMQSICNEDSVGAALDEGNRERGSDVIKVCYIQI